jgi:GDP-4-dehydro-6-deoxy-D-mannose reductase
LLSKKANVRVLITGARGFTARHLVRRLRQEPEVWLTGTGRSAAGAAGLGFDSYLAADLTDSRQVLSVVEQARPDWIFNLAGLVRGIAPDIYRVNLIGAVNLLEAVKCAAPNAAVLLVGSAAEYGIWPASHMPLSEEHECRPVGPYGLSKYAMTAAGLDYARNLGTKVIIARPFNLIGAGMPTNLVAGAIAQRAKAVLTDAEPVINVGNADSQRDFIAIEDAVDAYVKLLQSARWGEVFNVCSGEPYSIRQIIDTLLSFAAQPIRVLEDEALKRVNDAPVVVGDARKAMRACGFRARTSLHDALRAAWDDTPAPATAAATTRQ